ncbi:MAG TPA: Panacea domain-containing protein [Acidiferrobacter sp.]|nr:Panacea domain-containing protein [Acidiferrobacter sp.]
MAKYKMSPLFQEAKAAEVAAFFLLKTAQRNGSITLLKLMKLMYLSERESYRLFGEPIIGDALVSMPHGPVLSATLNFINAAPEERDGGSYWDKLIAEREDRYMTLRPDSGVASADDLLQLSEADADILEDIWKKFGSWSASKLRYYTHDPKNCPEWEDPDGSSIPIKLETLFRALEFNENQITAILESIEQQAWVAANLLSLNKNQ